VLFVSAVYAAENENAQSHDDTPLRHGVVLPERISKYLEEELPAYSLVSKSDYDQFWFENDEEPFHWIVQADLDDNGYDDYALLMKKGENVALVVVRQFKKRCKHDILHESPAGVPLREVVSLDDPGVKHMGMIDEVDAPKKELKNPSIITNILESCASLRYYWEGGEWHKVYIGL
jgi:hypothetical protein